jgi:hypothetical protein
MATSLCGSAGYKNTGAIACDIERGVPVMMIVGGGTFSTGDYADSTTMDAAIISKLKLSQGNSQKLYPFPVIQGNTDKTEAAKFATLGYGLQIKTVRSKPGYEFDVLAGSTLEKKLMSFDGKNVPVLILDDKKQMWGKKDGAANFLGAEYQVSVEPRGFGDAQNAKSTKISISIVDSQDFTENAYAYVTGLGTSSLTGLKDVTMSKLSNATNVHKIQLKIETAMLGNDLNIYDDYAAAIAALTFTAFTGATFSTSLTITSVAVDAALKALTVTFDSTAYTALSAGAKIKLVPPTSTVLDTASVTGIEISDLIITK